jgi:hypothetical protein
MAAHPEHPRLPGTELQALTNATLGDCMDSIGASCRQADGGATRLDVRGHAGGPGCQPLARATVGGAAISGWYVAPTAGTGADDIALGSSCANAQRCIAVGITIDNIATTGTFAPLVERWNGSGWLLGGARFRDQLVVATAPTVSVAATWPVVWCAFQTWR